MNGSTCVGHEVEAGLPLAKVSVGRGQWLGAQPPLVVCLDAQNCSKNLVSSAESDPEYLEQPSSPFHGQTNLEGMISLLCLSNTAKSNRNNFNISEEIFIGT